MCANLRGGCKEDGPGSFQRCTVTGAEAQTEAEEVLYENQKTLSTVKVTEH